MYDPRLRLSNQVVDEINKHFENIVYETLIHRNTRLGEAPSFGKPAIMYDADSKGAQNYMSLVREILQKNDDTKISQEDKVFKIEEDAGE
jgi:chromosome partitioning protein